MLLEPLNTEPMTYHVHFNTPGFYKRRSFNSRRKAEQAACEWCQSSTQKRSATVERKRIANAPFNPMLFHAWGNEYIRY